MKGAAPIRRTVQYLEAGKIVFKDRVQIFSVHYNTLGENHRGTREFVFWHLPQIQFKNPDVQVLTLKNVTPTPFIRLGSPLNAVRFARVRWIVCLDDFFHVLSPKVTGDCMGSVHFEGPPVSFRDFLV